MKSSRVGASFVAAVAVAGSVVWACTDDATKPSGTIGELDGAVQHPDAAPGAIIDATSGGGEGGEEGCLVDGSIGTRCGTSCVDLSSDPGNCGTCNNVCTAGAFCRESKCLNVAASLAGARWELPCTAAPESTNVCTTGAAQVKTVTLAGTAGTSYDVTLRLRGFVEQKTYTGGTSDAGAAAGGTNTGMLRVGGADNGDGFNVYQLTVSKPAQTFFVNGGASAIYTVFPIDATFTVRMEGNATVTLTADPKDGRIIANKDGDGGAIIIDGVPPAPNPFNGQLVQMDVIKVAPAPP